MANADPLKSQGPLQLTDVLPEWLAPSDFWILLATLAAFLAVMAVGSSIFERDRVSGKLKALKERRVQMQQQAFAPKRRKKKQEASVNWMRQIVGRFQLLKKDQVKSAHDGLIEAGWRSKDAVVIFAFFSLIGPIIGIIIGLVLMASPIWGAGTIAKFKVVAPIAFTYAGLKFPFWVVGYKRKKRYHQIQRALSDTLDLMTICAEAGLSLAAALDRVSKELKLAYPEMSEELSLTAIEMGLLPERSKSLLNLAERVKIQEVKGIVSVLIQTEKYGTPISQALRVLSKEFRTQRMMRAETKAARLPAVMTVPMILFILPTLFIVVMAPAFIRISRNLM